MLAPVQLTRGRSLTKHVAVVGAGGFIGRALVPALERAGYVVQRFTRDSPFETDGVLDRRALSAETVFYLANTINPVIAEREPAKAAADVLAFRSFLKASGQIRDLKLIVLPSSGGTVYDANYPPPYSESTPTNPSTIYSRTKLQMEEALLKYKSGAPKVQTSIVRISNVYGPGQQIGRGQGVVINWLDSVLRSDTVQMFGGGEETRDYLFISDLTEALIRLLDCRNHPEVLNVGSGIPVSLSEVEATIRRAIHPLELRIERLGERPFDRRHSYLEIDRAIERLGWKPAIGFEEGVHRTWKWLRSSRELGVKGRG